MKLRPGVEADAEELTRLHIRSMFTAMPWLPNLHSYQQTLGWMRSVVLRSLEVCVAERDGQTLGLAALGEGWLDQLYVDVGAQREGVGSALLDWAKEQRPGGLQLHVFTRNAPARAFYERAGFVKIAESDGKGNEEHEPDCTYAWQMGAQDRL